MFFLCAFQFRWRQNNYSVRGVHPRKTLDNVYHIRGLVSECVTTDLLDASTKGTVLGSYDLSDACFHNRPSLVFIAIYLIPFLFTQNHLVTRGGICFSNWNRALVTDVGLIQVSFRQFYSGSRHLSETHKAVSVTWSPFIAPIFHKMRAVLSG